ncbi:MAG TPA: hypothetical protein VG321_04415 [Solirubrobacteraceae bacterium]|nr:hypothetical protein [Solirubrobacteraceae bacterium]
MAVSLTGIDTVRLTTKALPRLKRQPDVAIEITGKPADYRAVDESLTIGVSTADIAGERDWFDLGVTISVDGRELPFADGVVAVASGDLHMLLAGGAYFSLLTAPLESLRRLIEEVRALSDSPSAGLRISRYQAGLWAELAALGGERTGLGGLEDRVSALGGRLVLESSPGGGTRVCAVLPVSDHV